MVPPLCRFLPWLCEREGVARLKGGRLQLATGTKAALKRRGRADIAMFLFPPHQEIFAVTIAIHS